MSEPIPVNTQPYGPNANLYTFQITPTATARNSPTRLSTSVDMAKRANHNAIERARREVLNFKFQELASSIPSLASIRKPSKSAIVQKAIEHIHDCHRRLEKTEVAARTLKLKNEQYRDEVNKLRQLLSMPLIAMDLEEQQAIVDLETVCFSPTVPSTGRSSDSARVSALTRALSVATGGNSLELNGNDDLEDSESLLGHVRMMSSDEIMKSPSMKTERDLDSMIENDISSQTNNLNFSDDAVNQLLSSSQNLTRLDVSQNSRLTLDLHGLGNMVPSTPLNTPIGGIPIDPFAAALAHQFNMQGMVGGSPGNSNYSALTMMHLARGAFSLDNSFLDSLDQNNKY